MCHRCDPLEMQHSLIQILNGTFRCVRYCEWWFRLHLDFTTFSKTCAVCCSTRCCDDHITITTSTISVASQLMCAFYSIFCVIILVWCVCSIVDMWLQHDNNLYSFRDCAFQVSKSSMCVCVCVWCVRKICCAIGLYHIKWDKYVYSKEEEEERERKERKSLKK